MRVFFFLLLLANLVFWGLLQGWFGIRLPDSRDPSRLQQQTAPEKIRVLSQDEIALLESGRTLPATSNTSANTASGTGASAVNAASAVAAAATATTTGLPVCMEYGGFGADDARKVETTLAALSLGNKLTQRNAEEPANYIVFIPALGSQAAAATKGTELRKLGVTDFFVLQEEGQFRYAISLGIFRSQESANKQLETLKTKGVKTAKVGTRNTTVTKTYFKFNPIDEPLRSALAGVIGQWPAAANDPRDCSAEQNNTGTAKPTTTSTARPNA